jgi:OmpA-OmpF porin, OOP family
MPMRKTFASILGLACWVMAGAAHAQVTGVKLTVSPYAGFTLYDQLVKLDDTVIFGGRVGLWFNNYVGVEGTYGYSPTKSSLAPQGDVKFHHVGGDLIVNLTPPYRVTPYITGGYARQVFDPAIASTGATIGKQSFDGWEAGVGLKAALSNRILVRIDARDAFAKLDQPIGDTWAHDFIFTAGLDFVLGGSVKDTDGDGVGDRKDRCPTTPLGAIVDANGCPIDSDGDGVPDGIDQCSNSQSGVRVDAKGCPLDGDGDGVPDGIDQCPDTPVGAKVSSNGCPIDGDHDGVPDGIDQCPNTAAGAMVDTRGCPIDSDGDGVPDGIDQCPSTPAGAKVDATGCPIEVSEKVTELLDTGVIRLVNVRFETGKAQLRPESYEALDEIGRILEQWPQLQIEIGGHTDSRGSAAFNQKLSEQRAQSVLDYLKSKFRIDSAQYTVKGYGESTPIADNDSETGRAQNRRVEFKVLNTETLKKEVEKRKLLRQD